MNTFVLSRRENRKASVKLKVNILVQRSFDREDLAKLSFQITRSLRQGSLSVEIKQLGRADRDKVTRNTCVTSINLTISTCLEIFKMNIYSKIEPILLSGSVGNKIFSKKSGTFIFYPYLYFPCSTRSMLDQVFTKYHHQPL